MRLLLAGGVWLDVEAVKLYKADEVGQIATTKAKAIKALGPGATAVGIGGTPSWTLAAEATALSLVSGFLAGVAAKQAVDQLTKVQAATELLLRETGTFFQLDVIKNISLPYPQSWSASSEGVDHIHSGDEFVWIQSERQVISVRWSQVAAIA